MINNKNNEGADSPTDEKESPTITKGTENEEESELAEEKTSSDIDEEDSFADLFNESLQKNSFKEGQLVKGTIVSISLDEIMIDIGYKSEGVVSAKEFNRVDGKVPYNVGDEIEIVVVSKEDDSGQIKLSKERADRLKIWDDISKAYDDKGVVSGKITNKVKGGFSVDIGTNAFLPSSQVDIRPVKNYDQYVGQVCDFAILEYNKLKGNIVLSRKALLADHARKLKEQLLSELHEGMVLEGIVKNITDFGVFVDIGNVDGLLHITDISWGRVSHPSDVFHVGDKIQVVILKYDKEKQRISLGHKQITEDPWKNAHDKYPLGAKVEGRVVTIMDYGAFVKIEDGIEGLIHVSEMSWTKKIKHPSSLLKVGDTVHAVILALDPNNRRLSLGLKQVERNPWELIVDKYPVGTIIERPVKNITDFGLFIEFEDGIDGLIHISDITWGKKPKSLKTLYKQGDMIKAKVMEINLKDNKCSLSIKELAEDPWKGVEKRFKKGSIVNGVIKSLTEFGAFIELEKDVEGLIHISEIKTGKTVNAPDHFKVGEEVQALVTAVSAKEKRIGLSVKGLEKKIEREEINKYLANQTDISAKLMDFVKPDDIAQKKTNEVK